MLIGSSKVMPFAGYQQLSNFVFYSKRINYKGGSCKNQPKFSLMTMGQYWLGKTKNAFRSTRNASKSCYKYSKFFLFNGIFY